MLHIYAAGVLLLGGINIGSFLMTDDGYSSAVFREIVQAIIITVLWPVTFPVVLVLWALGL
jgi:hypothetical protein